MKNDANDEDAYDVNSDACADDAYDPNVIDKNLNGDVADGVADDEKDDYGNVYAAADDTDDEDNVNVYCLSTLFPNTDDNPIEYIYTRDTTGRGVVSFETRLKVPRDEIRIVETKDADTGEVLDVKFHFKDDIE